MSGHSEDEETTPLISSNGDGTDVKIYSPREWQDPKNKPPVVSLRELFRFANTFDKILMVVGTFASIIFGAAFPAQYIILGEALDDFTEFMLCDKAENCTDFPDIESSMMDIFYIYIGYAFLLLLSAWIATACYGTAAERQCQRIKKALFRSMITQGVSWFDSNEVGDLNTRLSNDVNKINDGMGQKFARLIQCITTFFGAYAIGFLNGWKLALVMLSSLPLLFIAGGLMTKLNSTFSSKEVHAYSRAGEVAEEAISSIRTVAMFGGEKKESNRYNSYLDEARKFGIKKGLSTGFSMCVFQTVGYMTFALGFWYGTRLVIDDEMTSGDLFTVFFSMVLGNIVIGQAGPNAEALTTAKATAYEIFLLIDQTPELDPLSSEGQKPAYVIGDIEFEDINFCYPSRTDIQILQNFTLNIPSGKTIALVGESGCGKSTVIKLIQRFYSPTSGKILLDGHDITSLNVQWLRRLIGVVSQEPALFSTTIAENIGYGRDDATLQEIREAAMLANAHEFITQFPKGYDTLCGERGAQMSGGQKQRIAIARALIRNPKILLLDEATSALDLESESVVQDALDRAKQGRTTIIIAHRLSTIRDADVIVSLDKGTISQIGTHDELVNVPGIYSDLVTLQEIEHASPQDVSDDEKEEYADPGSRTPTSSTTGQTISFSQLEVTAARTFNASICHSRNLKEIGNKERASDDDLQKASFAKILKKNKKEWHYITLGIIGAAVYGCYPFVLAFLIGEFVGLFSYDPDIPQEEEKMRNESEKWSLFFIALGVGSGLGTLLQHWMFSRAGEGLTKRFREEAFVSYLRQDMSFFDDPSHNTGAVCACLATAATDVQGASGSRLGLFFSGIVTITGSFLVAFLSCWKLSLVAIAFFPLLVFSGTFLHSFYGGQAKTNMDKEAGKIVVEAFSNIQTVASLGREQTFYERYCIVVDIPYKTSVRDVHLAGLTQAFTQAVVIFCFAACFRYSGKLVAEKEVAFEDTTKTLYAISLCGVVLGEMSSMAPDYTKARTSAAVLFKIIESVPSINCSSESGFRVRHPKGRIEFKRVKFRYPFRPDVMVLKGLNLCVQPGQTVALVGSSGCGKSTTLALIERFYDPTKGLVLIDGNDVKGLNLSWLRRQIGVVSQEPVLFNSTIRENIAYGDNTREVSQNEIEEAAMLANVHDFITSLPMGYNTMVGAKGSLISGGQKQRIAIARALIRNPKILLLDEATSALDTESEKIVQKALDRASEGRTTLVIAHRLSTIQNADSIAVLKSGKVLEQGTHQQLMALKKTYYILQKRRQTNR